MPKVRSAHQFPWFGDISAVGLVGKVGVSLMLLGMLVGFVSLLLWPTEPMEFSALEAALAIPNALLLMTVSLGALGGVLYLMSYAHALARWAIPQRGPSSTEPR